MPNHLQFGFCLNAFYKIKLYYRRYFTHEETTDALKNRKSMHM